MKPMYASMLDLMESARKDFAAALPAPVPTALGPTWGYRFKSRDAHHAVVLKLAFIQSGLRAGLVLLEAGHVLEQALIQRAVDEASEDVTFIATAGINGDAPQLLRDYLDAFWAEEFDDGHDLVASHRSRPMTPRKKIRAYIGRNTDNPSRAIDISKVLSNAYSGFVHAASPHIMEMYVGSPPRFCTSGLLGTPRIEEYTRDFWNYAYRGLLAHIAAAKLFGSQQHVELLTQNLRQYEAAMGKDYSSANQNARSSTSPAG